MSLLRRSVSSSRSSGVFARSRRALIVRARSSRARSSGVQVEELRIVIVRIMAVAAAADSDLGSSMRSRLESCAEVREPLTAAAPRSARRARRRARAAPATRARDTAAGRAGQCHRLGGSHGTGRSRRADRRSRRATGDHVGRIHSMYDPTGDAGPTGDGGPLPLGCGHCRRWLERRRSPQRLGGRRSGVRFIVPPVQVRGG